MYLLDTNVCIDFARGRSEVLRNRIRDAYPRGLAISSITLAELRVGGRDGESGADDDKRLDTLVGLLDLRDFDAAAAEAYGRIAQAIGLKRRSFDRLIAAHAMSLGLIVVTSDEREFKEVPGLRIENWMRG